MHPLSRGKRRPGPVSPFLLRLDVPSAGRPRWSVPGIPAVSPPGLCPPQGPAAAASSPAGADEGSTIPGKRSCPMKRGRSSRCLEKHPRGEPPCQQPVPEGVGPMAASASPGSSPMTAAGPAPNLVGQTCSGPGERPAELASPPAAVLAAVPFDPSLHRSRGGRLSARR